MLGRGRRTRAAREAAPHGRSGRTGRTGRVVDLDPLRAGDDPPAGFESRWRRLVRHRTALLLAGLALWVVGLEARLVHVQVIQHDEYAARAQRQQESRITIEAPRGDIVDRDGRLLAYSIQGEAIAASPGAVGDVPATVAALCRELGCSRREREDLLARLASDRQAVIVRRARSVSANRVQRVRALDLDGIYFTREPVRVHPQVETAAHVVGFTGITSREEGGEYTVGRGGLEFARDAVLQGRDGEGITQKTGGTRRDRLETRVVSEPQPGASLELTIDLDLQTVVERELEAGVRANRAAGGTAIVMDPRTGEVLAMASYPTYNPNAGGPSASQANPAVGNVYEPGSTFKIVTASAALEEGVFDPGSLIDTSPGHIVVPGRRRAIRDTHNYGQLTFEDAIVKSSNVAAVKAGQQLGVERLARYVERFGFGRTLSPDFVGESAGIWSPRLNESGLASVSMGYQVSVTPLQMATAASVVANGGLLMEPHVVRAIIRDGVREPVPPRVIHRAISTTTARTLAGIMEGVVERGTATRAQVDGYRVAGKTGTSSKAVPGGYSTTDYNASFVGFVPARDPAFTILVVVDSPHAGSYYGGTVAAPIFQKIADAALIGAGIPRAIDPEPTLLVRARPVLPPARRLRAPSLVPLLTAASASDGPAMPDLRGLSGREALRMLSSVGLDVRMSGSGFVVAQVPAAGTAVDPGASASLELRRTPLAGDGRR